MITADSPLVGAARPMPGVDPAEVRLALRCPPALRPFNDLAVLSAADVHVARRLADLGREGDDAVVLGAALAVRALRLGHVCVDLADVHRTATTDADRGGDLSGLPWPVAATWPDRMSASALVGDGDGDGGDRPLRLVGSRLYLDRYWRQECEVAADLTARSRREHAGIDTDLLRAGLGRLWPDSDRGGADPSVGETDLQRLAGAAAVLSRFVVVAGGGRAPARRPPSPGSSPCSSSRATPPARPCASRWPPPRARRRPASRRPSTTRRPGCPPART